MSVSIFVVRIWNIYLIKWPRKGTFSKDALTFSWFFFLRFFLHSFVCSMEWLSMDWIWLFGLCAAKNVKWNHQWKNCTQHLRYFRVSLEFEVMVAVVVEDLCMQIVNNLLAINRFVFFSVFCRLNFFLLTKNKYFKDQKRAHTHPFESIESNS